MTVVEEWLKDLRSLSDYVMKGQLTYIIDIYKVIYMRKNNLNFTHEPAVCYFAITTHKWSSGAVIISSVKTTA